MSQVSEDNVFEWIRTLDPKQQTFYFSHLARELTTCARVFGQEENLEADEKISGLYAFNEIQHRILIRILPAEKILDSDGVELIIHEIYARGSKSKVLGSHIQVGLTTAKKRMSP